MAALITVLTATYNRAHLLPDLYSSLCRQTSHNFEWLIIDDGSTDETSKLVDEWKSSQRDFQICVVSTENKGKNRAINTGVQLIKTPFTMIVDSDDFLTDDAIAFLSRKSEEVLECNTIAGVAGMRSSSSQMQDQNSGSDVYILASNLERSTYNLQADANEVYKTSLLRTHPFTVWPGEKFVPEEIVWNQLALEGYRLRWYKKVTYISRYQENGMTRGSWKLFKDNPMGYAMMFNQRIILNDSIKQKVYNSLQMVSCCILGNELGYLLKSNAPFFSLCLLIPSFLLSERRKSQFKRFILNEA